MPDRRAISFVLTLVVLTTAASSLPLVPAQTGAGQVGERNKDSALRVPEHLRLAAAAKISERNNIPIDSLELVNFVTPEYRYSRNTANTFEFRDTRTGSLHRITLGPDLEEVTTEQLSEEDRAAYAKIYGKLSPALAERLTSARKNELIPVVVTIQDPPDTDQRPQQASITADQWFKMTEEEKAAFIAEQEEFRKKMDQYLAERAKRILTPIVEELRKTGKEVRPDRYFLMIYAELAPEAIARAQAFETVRRIDLQGKAEREERSKR